jgi:SAM-dependent methyltransferase
VTVEVDVDAVRALAEHLRADTFIDAVVRGARPGATPEWERVRIRPVEIAAGRRLQFECFDGRRAEVVNHEPDTVAAAFVGLFASGMRTALIRRVEGDWQVTISKRGRVQSVRHAPTADSVDTGHDRPRHHLLAEDAPFLAAVGIATAEGRVKPTARAKFRQVERFLEILDDAVPTGRSGRIDVVDLGCGAGVLTMAAHQHLAGRGLDVHTIGVDLKGDLVARLNRSVTDLGWHGIAFVHGSIDGWTPEPGREPDVVIALHACDTATDDALAAAIGWASEVVLVAPCCQHDLQSQIDASSPPDGFAALVRHGIVRERLGDLLTDTLRADICAAEGYRTDVIEFVGGEHTARNLMIRAVRTGRRDAEAARRVDEVAQLWSVEPALRRRLAGRADR